MKPFDRRTFTRGLAANEVVSANVDLRSIAAIQAALRERAARTQAGTWVLGHMYDDTKLAEGRPLSRRDLDAVSTEHPIFVKHRGGHTAVVNSRAFDIAGVTLETPDPEGGKFYREDGAFTGKVAEHAVDVFEAVGDWPTVDRADHAEFDHPRQARGFHAARRGSAHRGAGPDQGHCRAAHGDGRPHHLRGLTSRARLSRPCGSAPGRP